jgi:hypothetical protein
MAELSDFDRGLLIGLLVGEGSFGGDGKQPQVTLRMHTRHEALFRWLMERFPRTRLYGPYHHSGRSYYQWMARGRALVEDVLPILERELRHEIDGHATERLTEMCRRYSGYIERERRLSAPDNGSRAADGEPGDSSAADA